MKYLNLSFHIFLFICLNFCRKGDSWNTQQLASGFRYDFEEYDQVLPLVSKQLILSEHNKYRIIDLHKESSFNNLLLMTWSDEIAEQAFFRSQKCTLIDPMDEDKRTRSNIFLFQGVLPEYELIRRAIRKWDLEKRFFKSQECIGRCNHFVPKVWSDLYKVGCGISECKNITVEGKTWMLGQMLVCSYGLMSDNISSFLTPVE